MDDGQSTGETPANPYRSAKNDSEYVTRKRRPKRKANPTSSNSNKNKNEPQDTVANSNREDFSKDQENYTNPSVIQNAVKLEDDIDDVWNETCQTEAFKIIVDGQMKAPPETEVPLTPSEEPKNNSLKAEVELINESVNALPRINTKALPRTSTTYELEKFEKHLLLIFNQENINGYKQRLGTEKDVEHLNKTFSGFGFEVIVKNDLTKDEILEILDGPEFGGQDFTDYGCVAVAVLTHGCSHGLIRAKDQPFSELKIINHFKIDRRPTLTTKPKILIIQACRGGEDIKGVPVLAPYKGKTEKDHDDEIEPYTLPVESDMLIMHSSYIGKPSHRHELYGSWFIQSLCKKINELSATHDLESILTEVKREVAVDHFHEEYNKRTLEFDINKQMPVTTSTLMRKLYLRRFGESVKPTSAVDHSQVSAFVDDKHVLDEATPSTPMFIQFGPCSCFLEHYEYMKKCLKMYVDEFPEDLPAASFYKIACALEDGVAFNSPKEEILHAISLHLSNRPDISQRLRYLHPYLKKH